MSAAQKCPKCGAKLASAAFEGLCPQCLVGVMRAVPTVVVRTEQPGDTIGRYKLLQVIGEGGCGVVYMAEQEEPVRRKVALKVIKLGMDTKQVVARFEAERQALALMDHPNIAKVFDGGATDTGRPYFVMELVRGIKITDYCDENNLSTRERLDLFIQVCQAVQHAHQKGIIHRDLKPSNILVAQHDTVAVPKVIDFGIAKATSDQPLTDKTLFTAFAQFIGTPAYMSPEQAQLSGLDIDTRTDIYSLGVLLYELLTGQPPFDPEELMKSGVEAMRKTIREQEPVKPSTRLTMELVAADVRRRTSKSEIRNPKSEMDEAFSRRLLQVKELIPLLRGDLDWIVMKCLEKERTRRYETANAFAADLKRHLENEPVVARPPSTAYRLQKAFRRNKLAFTAAAAVGMALVVGVTVSTWQAFEARRAKNGEKEQRLAAQTERDKAQTAQKKAEQAAADETRQRQRAEEAMTRIEMERTENLFAADNSSRAMAYLARLLRQQPTNPVVAERLMSALTHRNFSLPSAPPFRHGSPMRSQANPTNVTASRTGYFTLLGGSIRVANFSPDGQRVVTASKDGTARVWDSRTGLPVGEPLQHAAEVMWAQFSRDGKHVVTASLDKTARIWNAETGEATTAPLQHGGGVLFADFSPDGRKVVTASQDNTVRLWHAETGHPLLRPLTQGAEVYFASFASDGSRLLTAQMDELAWIRNAETGEKIASFPHVMGGGTAGTPQVSRDGQRLTTLKHHGAVIWDVPTGKSLGEPIKHDNGVLCVRLSPDGRLVATASTDNSARVWDAETGLPITPPLKHNHWVESARFDAAGLRLATASRDNSARIWDALTGHPLTEPLRQDSFVRSAQFSRDGERLLTVSDGDAAWLWDIRPERAFSAQLRHEDDVRHAAFSPDGRRVATGSRDGTARVWDARTGRPVTGALKLGGWLLDLEFSPDGKRLVTASQAEAQVWDVATGKALAGARVRHYAFSARFSPDGRWVVTAAQDKTARVWNASTGKVLTEIRHGATVNCAQFSPDGQHVATACLDGTARVWDARTGAALTGPLPHDDAVHWVDFSPDGQRVATASKDKSVRLWDARTGQLLMKPLTHVDELYEYRSVQFSPDGKQVATAAGSIAQIWDTRTGEPLTNPVRHEGRVNSVRFSPDGQRLVTASSDATARIWSVATGHPLSEPLRHSSGRVQYAEFSQDGRFVVTASSEGAARVWEVAQAPLPVPIWLPELAEAVAGQSIDSRDISHVVPVADLFALRQKLAGVAKNDYYGSWADWFFGDGATRNLSPSSPVSVLQYVRSQIDENTLKSLREAVRVSPANVTALTRLSLAVLGRNPNRDQKAESEWLLRRATELAPDKAAIGRTRAEILVRLQRIPEAIEAMAEVLAQTQQTPEPWQFMGHLLQTENRLGEACHAYTAALGLAATNAASSNIRNESLLQRADLLRRLNRIAEARADYDELLGGDFFGALAEPAAWNAATEVVERTAGPAATIALLEKAANKHPENPAIWNARGTMLEKAEDFGNAYRALSKALELASADATVTNTALKHFLLNRCSLLRKMDRLGEAVMDYRRAKGFFPSSAPLLSRVRDYRLAPRVTVTLGATNQTSGLRQVDAGDGRMTAARVENESCRVLKSAEGSSYAYFIIDPTFKWECAGKVVIEVEYFDAGAGIFGIQYDGMKRTYSTVLKSVALAKTRKWTVAQFDVTDGRFENLQNADADFRLWIEAPQLSVRRVSVVKAKAGGVEAGSPPVVFLRPFPPRDPNARPNLINLEQHYNAVLTENWHQDSPENSLASLPAGVHALAGVDFDLRGLIQVVAHSQTYPVQVTGIAVGQPCKRVHFLHAALRAVKLTNGTPVGRYVIHTSDGPQEMPILVGRDLADWWELRNETNCSFALAWSGTNEKSRKTGSKIRLFKSTWENPRPEVPVRSIDFHATHPQADPFLIAITVE